MKTVFILTFLLIGFTSVGQENDDLYYLPPKNANSANRSDTLRKITNRQKNSKSFVDFAMRGDILKVQEMLDKLRSNVGNT